MANSYLRVHDPEDATHPTGLFPAGHAEKHERKERDVGDERGNNGDPNIHYMVNLTKRLNPPRAGYAYV
jgi:hypothetical protein